MMENKKAQAAMEFLMTYGWAILVVLAAIGALAYFGVLSPAKFMPETCTMPPTSGLACIDFKVTPTTAHMLIINGGGRDLHITGLSMGACNSTLDLYMTDNMQHLFNLTGCDFGTVGEKVKENLHIVYSFQDSNLTKTAQGRMVAVIAN